MKQEQENNDTQNIVPLSSDEIKSILNLNQSLFLKTKISQIILIF